MSDLKKSMTGQERANYGHGLQAEQRQRSYQIADYYRMKNDAADAEHGHSGWNAITPEFGVNAAIKLGGAAIGGWAGGMAARPKPIGGLFGAGAAGGFTPNSYSQYGGIA